MEGTESRGGEWAESGTLLLGGPTSLSGSVDILHGLGPTRLGVLQAVTNIHTLFAQHLIVVNHCATTHTMSALTLKQAKPAEMVLQAFVDCITVHRGLPEGGTVDC